MREKAQLKQVAQTINYRKRVDIRGVWRLGGCRHTHTQYSLKLGVQHLDGTICPDGIVGLDALPPLERRRKLLNLVPPSQILWTHSDLSAGSRTLRRVFFLLLSFIHSYPLEVEAGLNFGGRTGTPAVGLSRRHREQQQQQQQAAGSRHGSARRDGKHNAGLHSNTVYTKSGNALECTMFLSEIGRY